MEKSKNFLTKRNIYQILAVLTILAQSCTSRNNHHVTSSYSQISPWQCSHPEITPDIHSLKIDAPMAPICHIGSKEFAHGDYEICKRDHEEFKKQVRKWAVCKGKFIQKYSTFVVDYIENQISNGMKESYKHKKGIIYSLKDPMGKLEAGDIHCRRNYPISTHQCSPSKTPSYHCVKLNENTDPACGERFNEWGIEVVDWYKRYIEIINEDAIEMINNNAEHVNNMARGYYQ